MDEPQAGAFIISCLEHPVVRLLEVAVYLMAMDKVTFFISGGLGGWAAEVVGNPLALILRLLKGYRWKRDSMKRSRVFAGGLVWCDC